MFICGDHKKGVHHVQTCIVRRLLAPAKSLGRFDFDTMDNAMRNLHTFRYSYRRSLNSRRRERRSKMGRF